MGWVLLTGAMMLRAQTNDLSAALRQGLFEEEANRNLDAAVSNYQSLAAQFDRDRQVAATAVFRLGECYRKLGRTNDAVIQYERIVREFADQQTLVTLSRQNLTGLGVVAQRIPPSSADNTLVSLETRYQFLKLQLEQARSSTDPYATARILEDEGLKKLNEEGAEIMRQGRGTNQFSQEYKEKMQQHNERATVYLNSLFKERERELAALESAIQQARAGRPAGQLAQASATEPAATVVTDEEETEIRRIQAMIQNSPDLINAQSGEDLLTPLCRAAKGGQLHVAAFLLANGANINFKANGRAPLHFAAAAGQKAMVELLLDHNATVDNRDNAGWTPLYEVAAYGYKAVAETLLAHHANVNAQANDGRSPLHATADCGHLEVVKLLLANGSNVDTTDNKGRTPLTSAAFNFQNEAIVNALLEAKADPNGGKLDAPLFCAIKAGNTNLVELLLRAGANPNLPGRLDHQITVSRPGQTGTFAPLELAIAQNHAEIVKLLLQFKADPNGKSFSGKPLIFDALPNAEILEVMLDAGADPNQVGADGEPPLMKLYGFSESSERTSALAKLLIAHGAKVNARDKLGNTALDVAVSRGNHELIKLLLASKADVNARRPSDGATALHLAVQSGDRAFIDLLLANNPDVNMLDNAGKTPLDYAKASGSKGMEIVTLLRQHGALEDLPKLDRIEVCRPSANISDTVFRKGTNGWNQFTLLELIGQRYGFVSQDSAPARGVTAFGDWEWNQAEFRFPEFRKVTIQRVVDGGPQRKTIEIDLESLLASGDCSRDVVLQWGDRVEIPEADHPVDQHWPGLSTNQITTLAKCVSRNVTLIIKGVTNSVAVGPYYRPSHGGPWPSDVELPLVPGVEFRETSTVSSRYPFNSMQKAAGRFMLTAVLRGSGMLRASSDLSRVKVTRRDPATGRKLEWTLDCSGDHAPDLWLRDGDVIEVPEK